LVSSTVDPGNRHRGVPLGDGHVSGEDYRKGAIVLAEVDDSNVVRDLGRRGGCIPCKIVSISIHEVDTRGWIGNGRGPDILTVSVCSTDKEGGGDSCEEGDELHSGKRVKASEVTIRGDPEYL